jgi:hypothetical protein
MEVRKEEPNLVGSPMAAISTSSAGSAWSASQAARSSETSRICAYGICKLVDEFWVFDNRAVDGTQRVFLAGCGGRCRCRWSARVDWLARLPNLRRVRTMMSRHSGTQRGAQKVGRILLANVRGEFAV